MQPLVKQRHVNLCGMSSKVFTPELLNGNDEQFTTDTTVCGASSKDETGMPWILVFP